MTLTITSVANPVYSNTANTTIDVTLTTVELGIIPYTAAANDSTTYGQTLWAELQTGTYGAIAAYIAPPPPPPSPVSPLADLINTLIANGTIQSSQLQATTIATVNISLAAAGQSAIAISAKLS